VGTESKEQRTVMARYRVAPGKEAGFREVLKGHWQVLDDLGLVEPEPAQVYRQERDDGEVTYVEVFTWKPGAVGRAHEHPEVAAVWERITNFVAHRDGQPDMAFPHFGRVAL